MVELLPAADTALAESRIDASTLNDSDASDAEAEGNTHLSHSVEAIDHRSTMASNRQMKGVKKSKLSKSLCEESALKSSTDDVDSVVSKTAPLPIVIKPKILTSDPDTVALTADRHIQARVDRVLSGCSKPRRPEQSSGEQLDQRSGVYDDRDGGGDERGVLAESAFVRVTAARHSPVVAHRPACHQQTVPVQPSGSATTPWLTTSRQDQRVIKSSTSTMVCNSLFIHALYIFCMITNKRNEPSTFFNFSC